MGVSRLPAQPSVTIYTTAICDDLSVGVLGVLCGENTEYFVTDVTHFSGAQGVLGKRKRAGANLCKHRRPAT